MARGNNKQQKQAWEGTTTLSERNKANNLKQSWDTDCVEEMVPLVVKVLVRTSKGTKRIQCASQIWISQLLICELQLLAESDDAQAQDDLGHSIDEAGRPVKQYPVGVSQGEFALNCLIGRTVSVHHKLLVVGPEVAVVRKDFRVRAKYFQSSVANHGAEKESWSWNTSNPKTCFL